MKGDRKQEKKTEGAFNSVFEMLNKNNCTWCLQNLTQWQRQNLTLESTALLLS